MGDSENKIEYTAQELEEIDGILEVLDSAAARPVKASTTISADDLAEDDAAVDELIRSKASDTNTFEDDYLGEPEDLDLPAGDIDIPEEEIEDITSLIHEVTDEEEVQQEEPAETVTPSSFDGSPIEQLDALTGGEPESLDIQDMAEEEYIGLEEPEAQEEEEGVSLSSDSDEDMPDLDDLALREAGDIPEAVDSDIPDVDLGDLEGMDDDGADLLQGDEEDITLEKGEPETIIDEFEQADLGGAFDEITDQEQIPEIEEIDTLEPVDTSEIMSTEDIEEDHLEIEPLDDDDLEDISGVEKPADEDQIELSDKELKKLKKAIILYNPALIEAIKDTVVNDRLPSSEIRDLVDLILSGSPEKRVHQFIEEKLGRTVQALDETAVAGRKIITARPEYTREGRERQKRLYMLTWIFSGAVICSFLIAILSFQFIYKPFMAEKKINEGVALILKRGDYTTKPGDYQSAENIFQAVEENYRKDYLPGYNAYARAYFDRKKYKEYSRSLDKLNRAYKIDPTNITTLNNLGYFYSRVSSLYYNSIRSNINEWYFRENGKKGKDLTQLDLAINFYRRSRRIDPENTTALLGIGNAYFYQGQFLKAKKYYEDIIAVDDKSVPGYSGLINLYIEKDDFAQTVAIHSDLTDKKMLDQLPSALLGKLAGYYLDKRRTGLKNVRIDYGLQSAKFKDEMDNTFPAVRSVLKAMNRRDPNYPPLYLHSAKLSRAENKSLVMKRYLDKALLLSPDYYGALHLTGEYYYITNNPVEAYENFKKAIKANQNPQDFTTDDFYKETESVGKTHALMGNIFYYFFDKVKVRFGSIEDELIDDKMDKLANYNIARESYEMAIKSDYSSSELHYNLGRIYYLNSLYREALNQWLHLYDDFVDHPEIMIALGNSFYHLRNYEAGKGEYLKLVSVFEREADNIKFPQAANRDHIRIFQTLASGYNNLGAVYQAQNDERKSSISYWKAVDYARRIGRENEFARVNLGRSFKSGKPGKPVLDENVPYSIGVYREEMRK